MIDQYFGDYRAAAWNTEEEPHLPRLLGQVFSSSVLTISPKLLRQRSNPSPERTRLEKGQAFVQGRPFNLLLCNMQPYEKMRWCHGQDGQTEAWQRQVFAW